MNLDKMIEKINKLAASTNLNLIRIDTYSDNKNFYIGEITNIHGNCLSISFLKIQKKSLKIYIWLKKVSF